MAGMQDEAARPRLLSQASVKVVGAQSFSSASGGDLRLETGLNRRLPSFRALTADRLQFVSFAPDKSRVGSLALLNTPLVLPSNVGFPAPPAVI